MKKVLVVDDQLGIRLLLEEIIKNEGHEVISCQDGPTALAKAKEKKPDLLLIDYRLPLMDGCRVIEELERIGIWMPIIVMSGLVEEAMENTTHLRSVQSYFAKPFNISEVKDQINLLLV